jgi:hypothetical protein
MKYPADEPLSRATDSLRYARNGQHESVRTRLLLIEGTNDIEFVTRISRVLTRDAVLFSSLDPTLDGRRLVFVPVGGKMARVGGLAKRREGR